MSDRSFPTFPSEFPTEEEARSTFAKVLNEEDATAEETKQFTGFIMLFLCRLYSAKGWTMQVHLGPLRNNSSRLLSEFGPDAGTDSIGDWNQAESMSKFLDKLDMEDSLPKTIVYNNNPADNFTLSTMLGNKARSARQNAIRFRLVASRPKGWNGRTTEDAGQCGFAFTFCGDANGFPFFSLFPTS